MSKFYVPALTFPYIRPQDQGLRLVRQQQMFQSPLNADKQVADRDAYAWRQELNYTDLNDVQLQALHGFMSRARGQYSHVMVPDFSQPTTVGSWTNGSMYLGGADDTQLWDSGNWSRDNAAVKITNEPYGIGFMNTKGKVNSETVLMYDNPVSLPSSDNYTVRMSVRPRFGGEPNVGSTNFKVRFGTNPGSISLASIQVHSMGYYTFALDVNANTPIYLSFLFNISSCDEGEGVIIDRMDIFRGTRVSSWVNKNSAWLRNLPSTGHLMGGSRIEVTGCLLALENDVIQSDHGAALAQYQPGVPSSFANTESWQMCPFYPHGRYMLDSPDAYAFDMNPINYHSTQISFIGDTYRG